MISNMDRSRRWFLIASISIFMILGQQTLAQEQRIMVYTKNGEGYVHKNIAHSVAALKKLGKENGFLVDTSDDPDIFSDDNLKQYAVLVFSNTNNQVFDTEDQKQAFQNYIRMGGGFVGIHCASGSERQWPWYWQMLGGTFYRHAPLQTFKVKVLDDDHPSTNMLPKIWEREDECYYLKQLNPDINVLLTADMTSVIDEKKGEYPGDVFHQSFPLAWYHQYDGGWQWYTSLGHKIEHYQDEVFMSHILGGIQWAMDKQQTRQ